MADRNTQHAAADTQWRDAFAAVAPEAPPEQAWARVAAALDAEPSPVHRLAHRSMRRRRIAYALAATFALAALVPIALRPGLAPDDTRGAHALASHRGAAVEPALPIDAATGAGLSSAAGDAFRPATGTGQERLLAHDPGAAGRPATRESSSARRNADAPPPPRQKSTDRRAGTGVAQSAAVNASAPVAAAAARDDEGPFAASARVADSQFAPTRVEARGTQAGSLHESTIATSADELPAPSNGAATGDGGSAFALASLDALYVRSAQLEQLVALSRNDQVASGSGSVLADALGERIAQIDEALAQPGLAATDHAALWEERVVALGQLAGIASTERWLAANGETFSTALVRVD